MTTIMDDLHQEHLHLTRVFNILEEQVNIMANEGDPDLFLMVDIVNYVQHYPDLVHHPKEDKVYDLFSSRSKEGADIVKQLQDEHKFLPTLTNEVHDMLVGAANSVLFVSREELFSKIQHFLETERKHMNLEEDTLFPLIKTVLSEEDWDSLELSALMKADPLFGNTVEARYQNLYQSIKAQGAF